MARVLIIDDEQRVRTMLRHALAGCDHDVREAHHGLLGMTLLEKEPADLVITDIFMPVQDGLQTIRELRKLHPETKVIAMSGPEWADTYDVLTLASKLGAHRVLRKPFTSEELQAAVTECLRPVQLGCGG